MASQDQVTVVVDVMGGDEPPQVVLDGIAAALAADPALTILAAGPADLVAPFCNEHERALPLIAEQAIGMGDDPIEAVMRKRKSSIVLGCRAVKKGQAQGFFSAGSTGAIVAAATAYVTPEKVLGSDGKRRPIRPCITSALPNRAGGLTVFCDMGGSPDVEPEDMVRFAQMGSAYAMAVLGIERPRVGLLSNGTEEHKGSAFTKRCYPLMAERVPGFAGNCEGGDLTSGNVDVVVCDGFTGNVALKATEGAARLLLGEMKATLLGSLKGKIAALLIKDALHGIKDKLSGDARGGAILLGLHGVVLIGHGATSVEAVKNGALATAQAVRAGLVQRVASSMLNVVG